MFLIKSIHLDQGTNCSCPAKTVAIIAHMRDFSYGKLPDPVETINKCTNIVELQKQVLEGKLPKLCEY